MFSSKFIVVSIAVFLGFAGLSKQIIATENITDMELISIPNWCKSAFKNSDYREKIAIKMSPTSGGSQVKSKPTSGMEIPGGHHFCAGLVELNRAKRGKGAYSVAISEINYSYSRLSTNSLQISYVSSYLGKALYLSGKRQEGVDVWQTAIAAQPSGRESYLALAEVLFGNGRNEQALEVLLEYEKVKENDFPDTEQFLAQAYFNLKQYENAKIHAENAKKLGYPFTGLLEKLNKLESNK